MTSSPAADRPGFAEKVGGSFRDPSGFVYRRDGRILRQVNGRYRPDYDHLLSSGLYQSLVDQGLLIPHEEVALSLAAAEDAYRVLEPRRVGFVSYPYEWCFSQLKQAALTTLRIEKAALEHGMTLKDASAYNVQFEGVRPVFIDTLSFEHYREGRPWTAYRQFCQHFLAPLALTAFVDARLQAQLRTHLDGVPLDLACSMLPQRTRLKPSLAIHLHLHARSQRTNADAAVERQQTRAVSRLGRLGLLDSLTGAVAGLTWKPKGEWAGYYSATNYSDDAFERKRRAVSALVAQAAPRTVWDLGANTGVFSRIAAEKGIETLSIDFDPAAVETNFLGCRSEGVEHLHPLVGDLTNPSPGLGWAGEERQSLEQRGPADLVIALALIHHLAIANNTPLEKAAEYFARLGRGLIIEFVPKQDSQVQRMLGSREDIFDSYSEEGFERAFERFFVIRRRLPIDGSDRVLYRMDRRAN